MKRILIFIICIISLNIISAYDCSGNLGACCENGNCRNSLKENCNGIFHEDLTCLKFNHYGDAFSGVVKGRCPGVLGCGSYSEAFSYSGSMSFSAECNKESFSLDGTAIGYYNIPLQGIFEWYDSYSYAHANHAFAKYDNEDECYTGTYNKARISNVIYGVEISTLPRFLNTVIIPIQCMDVNAEFLGDLSCDGGELTSFIKYNYNGCEINEETSFERVCGAGTDNPKGLHAVLDNGEVKCCNAAQEYDFEKKECVPLCRSCVDVYGENYIPCRKEGSSGGYEKCCAPDEKCCPGDLDDKTAEPVCCPTEVKEGYLWGSDRFSCAELKRKMYDQELDFNYCKINNQCVEPKPQYCDSFWRGICCKAEPEEYCAEQTKDYNTPFCAKKISDDETCPGGEEYECYRINSWGKDEVMCCEPGKEKCDTFPIGGKKFCNGADTCPYGEPCVGRKIEGNNDASWIQFCCDKGEICYHHPNGAPKCYARAPEAKEVGGPGQISSFSIYMQRESNDFKRDGIAFRFQPHGLEFNVPSYLTINNQETGDKLYMYPDEGYVDNCYVSVLDVLEQEIGVNGGVISNEYFNLNIPLGALSETQDIVTERINIICESDCNNEFGYDESALLLLEIDNYYNNEISLEELNNYINEWKNN